MTPKEIFMREIIRYPKYFILPCGMVFSSKKGGYLKSSYDKQGYERVALYHNGKAKTIKVHRLVAEAYIPNPHNKTDVNHKDGDKSNNDVSNLEWVTRSENIKHAFENGLKTITNKQLDRFIKMVKSQKKGNNPAARRVINIDNKKVYETVTEAAEDIRMKRTTLIAQLTGQNKNKTRLRYYE